MIRKLMSWGAIIATALTLVCIPAQAFVNGGFETGNLDGWSSIGNVAVGHIFSGEPALEGSYLARLSTDTTQLVAGIESSLGLGEDMLKGWGATGGSAIWQTITVGDGGSFEFDYRFRSPEFMPFNDFSFVAVLGEYSGVSELSSVATVGGTGDSYWQHWSCSLPAGTYTVGIGVVNIIDTSGASTLLVDGARSTTPAVPEPASIVLAILGISAGGVLRRPRK